MGEHNIFSVIQQDGNKWPSIVKFSQANCAKLFTRGLNELVWQLRSGIAFSLACVASVSVWFRSKERPRNGIFRFGLVPRNKKRSNLSSYIVFDPFYRVLGQI